MERQSLNGRWQMRRVGDPVFSEAIVPGSVYTDLLRNGQMEDPFFKDNELKALRLMDEDYEYVTSFDCAKSVYRSDRKVLRFDGIDTIADVYLNGEMIGSPDNMHRTWEYDVTEEVKEKGNELRIVFHSPNKYIAEAFQVSKTHGSEDAMDGFVNIRKAHCMFGWDWGAHLPDAGLFRPVTLLGVDEARIDSVYVTQEHANGKVTLHFAVDVDCCPEMEDPSGMWNAETEEVSENEADPQESGLYYTVKVTAPDGIQVHATGSPEQLVIENPQLWWPNGYGRQDLYTVEVTLCFEGKELDCWKRRIGLRTMTVDRSKNEWGENFAICVNGVDIFAMGADYIPEDHLLGRVAPETTRALLEKSKWANFNAIRVWGGGYYPEDWFYDLCDELGFVVWQDFMFACAVYDLTPEFEANIRAEFIDNIKRLRHHASLGLWCGNNEMEEFVYAKNSWLTKPQEVRDYYLMYERIIPEIVKEYDPQTFYWPSSPSSGGCLDEPQDPERGDVHYWDVWHGNKPFTEYRKFYFRFLSEFGFQSFPALQTVKRFTEDGDRNIFSRVMEMHQRNTAANGKILNYISQTYLYPKNFDELLYCSQLLQADAIRYGVEHFRRFRGTCMGAVVWQLNDIGPVASWASVDYYGNWKALQYAEKKMFAPVLLSCEEHGEIDQKPFVNTLPHPIDVSADLHVANETGEPIVGTVKWSLCRPDSSVVKEGAFEVNAPAYGGQWMPHLDFNDQDPLEVHLTYELVVDGNVVSSGSTLFCAPKHYHFADPKLSVSVDGDTVTVTAENFAKSVSVETENGVLRLDDNFVDMEAGTKTFRILPTADFTAEGTGVSGAYRVRSVYETAER